MSFADNLLNAAKQIGMYIMITVSVYLFGFIGYVIVGFLNEKVVTSLGLNASGSAVTAISTSLTAANTAITAILAIVTIITGLLTLNVVLTAFGVKLNLNMGETRV